LLACFFIEGVKLWKLKRLFVKIAVNSISQNIADVLVADLTACTIQMTAAQAKILTICGKLGKRLPRKSTACFFIGVELCD
jgi:hypothetical protein